MIKKKLLKNAKKVDQFLSKFLKGQKQSLLVKPMKYGVISGGKKIRSTIILEAGKLFKVKEKITTPDGRKVVVCPAQTCAPTKCETCKLCSKSDRKYVVAFVAHGGGKKKVDTFLNK